jgi:hypothetical protein
MTLLAAAQSLGIIELAGVSWVNVHSMHTYHVAVFTIALLLPFGDPLLPTELSTGELRFWPDRVRVLESEVPMQDQILELQRSGMLGNLAVVTLMANQMETPALWLIETHTRSRDERMTWLRSVIAMEGRIPIG